MLPSIVGFVPVSTCAFTTRKPLKVSLHNERFHFSQGQTRRLRDLPFPRRTVACAISNRIGNGVQQDNAELSTTTKINQFNGSVSETKRKPISRFLKLVATEKRLLIPALIAAFGASICTIVQPVLFGGIVGLLARTDIMTQQVARKTLYKRVGRIATAYVIEVIMTLIYVALTAQVFDRATRKLRQQVFKATIQNDVGYFDEAGRTEIERTISNDIKTVRNGVWDNLSRDRGLRAVIEIVFGLLLCFVFTGTIGAPVFCVLVPILSTIVAQTGLRNGRLAVAVDRKESVIQFFLNERMRGLRTLKAFGAENREMRELNSVLDDAEVSSQKFGVSKALTECANRISIYVTITTYFISGGLLICSGVMDYQTFSYLTGFVWILNFSMQGISFTLTDFGKVSKALDNIYKLLDGADEYQSSSLQSTLPVAIPEKIIGEVQFEKVSFHYPSRPEVLVLRDINFSIRPGQTVALVGESGGGKSTIAAVLSRFYAATTGTVWIDGMDIQSLPRDVYTRLLSVVDQEPVLFEGTIRDNIAYGLPDAEVCEADIIQAAKEANAHEFILNLPQAYDTVWSPGSNISGGQRQRIAIARSLVKSPRILVLDEATSALDQESERIVQKSLDRIMQNRTVLVIAHRLSTVRSADQILFVKAGQILERGTYEELFAKPNGHFRNLVQAAASLVEEGASNL